MGGLSWSYHKSLIIPIFNVYLNELSSVDGLEKKVPNEGTSKNCTILLHYLLLNKVK